MPPTVQPAKSPPTAPAMNGHAALNTALSSAFQSMSIFIFVYPFLFLVLTTENSETPAAARKRLSCPERDSFANPFPCPQGGFGDFRGEIGFLRPVSWDAFRRFVQLSKIEAPKGLGRGRQLGSPRR